MNNNEMIIVSGVSGVALSLADEAAALRDSLVGEARAIKTVSDELDYNIAVDVMKRAKELLRVIEEARKEAKRPLDEKAREIQDLAAGFRVPLEEERERVSKLIIAWEDALRRQREEAQRKAREEQQRILLEAQMERDRTAEAARKAALAEGRDPDRAEAAAEKAVMDGAALAVAQSRQELANSGLEKAKGLRRTTVRKFEIVDEALLLKERPDLFSPSDTKIRAALRLTMEIPGLRTWEETKV